MAHFPPAFLDEVVARSDIVEIIARHVELKKSGANLMGLCPFHHEKSPSFSVSPDKQLYYCFGCGQGGGAFQFLAYTMLSRASDAMSRALDGEHGRAARTYLQQRGLPVDIIRDYGLGYAPAGYGFMNKVFGNDARSNSQLEAVGLLFKGERGYGDRFRDRLMFSIRDRRGRIVGFGGRVLGEGEPKYLNSPETDWFHKSDLLYGFSEHRDTIRKTRQLVVVEGYMDVLGMAAHGLKIGLAPLGTAIGERQIREIFRLCDSPVFSFDGDRAGRQAAWRALDRMLPLLKSELMPRFLYLPEGEDPDSLLKAEGEQAFRHRLDDESKPVLETWLMGLKLLAGQGADGRARMAKKADAMLATMTDAYLRQAWQQEVEHATGIALQQARRRSQATRSSSQQFAARRTEQSAAKSAKDSAVQARLNAVEERFLAALMQQPGRFQMLPDFAVSLFVDNEGVSPIYSRAFSIITEAEDDNTDIARQLAQAYPDRQTMISRWVNQATVQDIEFKSLLLDMEANDIRRRIKRGLSLVEAIPMQNRLREIQQEQRPLTEQLHETGA